MLSLAAPVRPLITNLGRFINMSSQALGLQGSRTQDLEDCVSQCCKASFVRTVCSSCAKTSDEKTTDETQDGKLAKNEVLQWNNLSHNEKKIYFAHKHACLVRSGFQLLGWVWVCYFQKNMWCQFCEFQDFLLSRLQKSRTNIIIWLCTFFTAWHWLHLITSNSVWLIMQFGSFVTGQSNCFVFGFITCSGKLLLNWERFPHSPLN